MKLRQPDKHIFRHMSTFTPEHRTLILKHIKDLMVRIHNGSLTVEETRDGFDNLSQQLTKLINYYKK